MLSNVAAAQSGARQMFVVEVPSRLTVAAEINSPAAGVHPAREAVREPYARWRLTSTSAHGITVSVTSPTGTKTEIAAESETDYGILRQGSTLHVPAPGVIDINIVLQGSAGRQTPIVVIATFGEGL